MLERVTTLCVSSINIILQLVLKYVINSAFKYRLCANFDNNLDRSFLFSFLLTKRSRRTCLVKLPKIYLYKKNEFPYRSYKFDSDVDEFRDDSSRHIDCAYCARVL